LAIFDLYSKRQKKLRGDTPDVYVYDRIPQTLKVQITYIWFETLGDPKQSQANFQIQSNVLGTYELIVKLLRKEYGVFQLPRLGESQWVGEPAELCEFFLENKDIDRTLDVIEVTFRAIDNLTREFDHLFRRDASKIADAAIEELNARFQEHGVGYQYVNGEIIRIDSELIHAEVVRPALRLLNQNRYAGAQQEFLKAHEHYRSGDSKEALNECLKSFESLMKGICDKRGWPYNANGTAKDLIQTCMDNGLIPTFWQNQFASLRSLLESSVPTGRNKLSGHGQGTDPTTVPDYLVAYMLHMTASAIVFLAEAENSLP
jgi:hypothetical protein